MSLLGLCEPLRVEEPSGDQEAPWLDFHTPIPSPCNTTPAMAEWKSTCLDDSEVLHQLFARFGGIPQVGKGQGTGAPSCWKTSFFDQIRKMPATGDVADGQGGRFKGCVFNPRVVGCIETK